MIINAEWISKTRAVAKLPGGGSVTYNYGSDASNDTDDWVKASSTSFRLQCSEGSITCEFGGRSPSAYPARDSMTLASAIGAEPKAAGKSMEKVMTTMDGYIRTGEKSWWCQTKEGGITVRLGDHAKPKARRSAQDRAARAIVDAAPVLVRAIMRGATQGPGLDTLITRQGWRKHT